MDHPDRGQDDARNEHYFTERTAVPSRRSTVRLDLPDLSVDLTVDRGVFSPSRVDPGTKLLLGELPTLGDGPVLDLGCGYGPIATTLALRRPGQPLWAIDVSERARDLCKENLESHAPEGTPFHVVLPDQVPEDIEFRAIVSNPPIRIGKAALRSMLERWLNRLAHDGEAWLVVNKNLGADSLARWMTTLGFDVDRVRSRAGYRILRVIRSRDTRPADPAASN